MTTFVGTQSQFHDALHALCELDFDAIEAYKAAISGIKNELYKQKLTEFMQDHERHVANISTLLEQHNYKAPTGPDMKHYLTVGKVEIAKMLGDKAILMAIITNEQDTNAAYQRVNEHVSMWPEAAPIVTDGMTDEKSHKQWLETTVHSM